MGSRDTRKVFVWQQGQALLWLVIMKANATVTLYPSALVSTWLAEIMRNKKRMLRI